MKLNKFDVIEEAFIKNKAKNTENYNGSKPKFNANLESILNINNETSNFCSNISKKLEIPRFSNNSFTLAYSNRGRNSSCSSKSQSKKPHYLGVLDINNNLDNNTFISRMNISIDNNSIQDDLNTLKNNINSIKTRIADYIYDIKALSHKSDTTIPLNYLFYLESLVIEINEIEEICNSFHSNQYHSGEKLKLLYNENLSLMDQIKSMSLLIQTKIEESELQKQEISYYMCSQEEQRNYINELKEEIIKINNRNNLNDVMDNNRIKANNRNSSNEFNYYNNCELYFQNNNILIKRGRKDSINKNTNNINESLLSDNNHIKENYNKQFTMFEQKLSLRESEITYLKESVSFLQKDNISIRMKNKNLQKQVHFLKNKNNALEKTMLYKFQDKNRNIYMSKNLNNLSKENSSDTNKANYNLDNELIDINNKNFSEINRDKSNSLSNNKINRSDQASNNNNFKKLNIKTKFTKTLKDIIRDVFSNDEDEGKNRINSFEKLFSYKNTIKKLTNRHSSGNGDSNNGIIEESSFISQTSENCNLSHNNIIKMGKNSSKLQLKDDSNSITKIKNIYNINIQRFNYNSDNNINVESNVEKLKRNVINNINNEDSLINNRNSNLKLDINKSKSFKNKNTSIKLCEIPIDNNNDNIHLVNKLFFELLYNTFLINNNSSIGEIDEDYIEKYYNKEKLFNIVVLKQLPFYEYSSFLKIKFNYLKKIKKENYFRSLKSKTHSFFHHFKRSLGINKREFKRYKNKNIINRMYKMLRSSDSNHENNQNYVNSIKNKGRIKTYSRITNNTDLSNIIINKSSNEGIEENKLCFNCKRKVKFDRDINNNCSPEINVIKERKISNFSSNKSIKSIGSNESNNLNLNDIMLNNFTYYQDDKSNTSSFKAKNAIKLKTLFTISYCIIKESSFTILCSCSNEEIKELAKHLESSVFYGNACLNSNNKDKNSIEADKNTLDDRITEFTDANRIDNLITKKRNSVNSLLYYNNSTNSNHSNKKISQKLISHKKHTSNIIKHSTKKAIKNLLIQQQISELVKKKNITLYSVHVISIEITRNVLHSIYEFMNNINSKYSISSKLSNISEVKKIYLKYFKKKEGYVRSICGNNNLTGNTLHTIGVLKHDNITFSKEKVEKNDYREKNKEDYDNYCFTDRCFISDRKKRKISDFSSGISNFSYFSSEKHNKNNDNSNKEKNSIDKGVIKKNISKNCKKADNMCNYIKAKKSSSKFSSFSFISKNFKEEHYSKSSNRFNNNDSNNNSNIEKLHDSICTITKYTSYINNNTTRNKISTLLNKDYAKSFSFIKKKNNEEIKDKSNNIKSNTNGNILFSNCLTSELSLNDINNVEKLSKGKSFANNSTNYNSTKNYSFNPQITFKKNHVNSFNNKSNKTKLMNYVYKSNSKNTDLNVIYENIDGENKTKFLYKSNNNKNSGVSDCKDAITEFSISDKTEKFDLIHNPRDSWMKIKIQEND